MTANSILVTPRSLTRGGHPALDRLELAGYQVRFCSAAKQPEEAELLQLLPGCVGYLAGVEPISRRALSVATELRAISRNGTGVNNIDLQAAHELNIAVLRAEGANARGVAELTIGLMFALLRHIPASDRALKTGTWQRFQGREVQARTLGLVGSGKIGQLVAQLAIGLGMQVIAYDPFPALPQAAAIGFTYVEWMELLSRADIISLHCPSPADGMPLITRASLAGMKEGVCLINTARGELLDDDAVQEALDSGRLAGVALDAYRIEPPAADGLVTHERVIAVPHIGAFTAESVTQAVEMAVDNLLSELSKHKGT